MISEKYVYIIDDDDSVRTSTAFFLSSAGFVTKTFGGGHRFLFNLDKLQPGCVLLDIGMPDMNGLKVIETLTPNLPRFPVVVMTGHGDIGTAVQAMKLGARDFIEKPFAEDLLLRIFEQVFSRLDDGVSAEIKRCAAVARIATLTSREAEVLGKMLNGKRSKQIAYEMGVSIRTIETQRASMMDSLHVHSSAEVLRLAFDAGLDATAVIQVEPEAVGL